MKSMTTLTLEVGDEATPLRCHCCNVDSMTGHGFIYEDGDARAVYYAGWAAGHRDRGVTLAIAVGGWDDQSTTADRTCFGLEAYEGQEHILFRFINPEESPWPKTDLLGAMLGREDALKNPLSGEILRIAETIVRDHASVRVFLGASP